MKKSIEQIIANLRLWDTQGDLKIAPIGDHNFTNQNYRVESNGQVFKVRISEGNQNLIGSAREEELIVLQTVAKMGIGPEVIAYIPPEGHLVTRFIEGKHFSLREITQSENIYRIVQILKQVHAIEGIDAVPSPFERIEGLIRNAERKNAIFPDDFKQLLANLQAIKAVLTKVYRKPCLCHNDLARSNIIESNGSIFLIDWEYAGMGNPMFDLANFSMNQNLDTEGDQILIESYFGKVSPVELAEINLWKIVSIFIEAVWGILQAKISQFDRNYQGFSNENWQTVRQYIQKESFSEWLSIVSFSSNN